MSTCDDLRHWRVALVASPVATLARASRQCLWVLRPGAAANAYAYMDRYLYMAPVLGLALWHHFWATPMAPLLGHPWHQ
jgi:hypothetical protein